MRDAPAQSEARLLVVDDEPTVLELLAGTLRFAGFGVLTAVSGAEALRAAAAAKPDLILLDVMMPDCGRLLIRQDTRPGQQAAVPAGLADPAGPASPGPQPAEQPPGPWLPS
jgi:CheY-like chemotaxis protein